MRITIITKMKCYMESLVKTNNKLHLLTRKRKFQTSENFVLNLKVHIFLINESNKTISFHPSQAFTVLFQCDRQFCFYDPCRKLLSQFFYNNRCQAKLCLHENVLVFRKFIISFIFHAQFSILCRFFYCTIN